jgi:hypothetical protein
LFAGTTTFVSFPITPVLCLNADRALAPGFPSAFCTVRRWPETAVVAFFERLGEMAWMAQQLALLKFSE